MSFFFFFFNDTETTEIYTYVHSLSLHDALPIYRPGAYLSVTVVSPRVAAPVKGGVELGKPTFRMGYATLPVEDPYRELQVRVTPSKQEAKQLDAVREIGRASGRERVCRDV